MRTIMLAALLAIATLVLDGASSPSSAGCEIVACETQCWQVGPHTRRCQPRCLRRCWQDAPRYYAPAPQPRYYAVPQQQPQYHAPVYQPTYQAGPRFDPALIIAFAVAGIVATVLVAVSASSRDSTTGDIEAVEQQTRSTRAQTADYDATIRDIHVYRATLLEDAEQQGRRDADDDWRRLTHD